MNVLSVFDGMSCGMIALERAGIEVTNYYASEIDKYASIVSEKNYPEIKRLGCITKHDDWDLPQIDLLIAGFPCQAWSLAGKQKGDNDPRGALIHDLISIWKKYKPKNFMFENVKMKKEFLEYINTLFGVEPILINSALVSAQNRNRYYWTNIPGIEQPEDKGILLKDIIESDVCVEVMSLDNDRIGGATENDRGIRFHRGDVRKSGISELGRLLTEDSKKTDTITSSHSPKIIVDRDKSHCIDANYFKGGNLKSYFEKHRRQLIFIKDGLCHVGDADLNGNDCIKRVYSAEGKSPTLTTMGGGHREPKILCEDTPSFNEWLKDTKDYGGSKKEYDELFNGCSMVGRKINPITGKRDDYNNEIKQQQYIEVNENPDKSRCLSTVQKDTLLSNKKSGRHFPDNLKYRKLTPLECERLQTIPDNYTNHVSNTQRYKMIGNGWTVDVIAHIFKGLA